MFKIKMKSLAINLSGTIMSISRILSMLVRVRNFLPVNHILSKFCFRKEHSRNCYVHKGLGQMFSVQFKKWINCREAEYTLDIFHSTRTSWRILSHSPVNEHNANRHFSWNHFFLGESRPYFIVSIWWLQWYENTNRSKYKSQWLVYRALKCI